MEYVNKPCPTQVPKPMPDDRRVGVNARGDLIEGHQFLTAPPDRRPSRPVVWAVRNCSQVSLPVWASRVRLAPER
jgi:hypothetical protein